MGGAADAAPAGAGEGRAPGLSGEPAPAAGDRGLSAAPAGQSTGRRLPGAEKAPAGGVGGFAGHAGAPGDHRPALPRHGHRQNSNSGPGRKALRRQDPLFGPHPGAGRPGGGDLPGAVAGGGGGALHGGREGAGGPCGLRQCAERGAASGGFQG